MRGVFSSAAIGIVIAGFIGGPADAADPNGWCLPYDECMGEQKPIVKGSWNECESSCEIDGAVDVHGLNASLYNLTCKGDSDNRQSRVMFVFTRNHNGGHDFLMITNNGVTELEQCNNMRN